jgi:Holliday junction DNA helicase RuvA
MYAYINGIITEIEPSYVVIDNNGIGYKVFVANPFYYKENENYKIYLYNHIREDENSLYGFKNEEELNLFLKLINVKGLGPKMANTFFATGSVNGIIDAINRENIIYLTKYPKIGEKIAKQMILDLKGKINLEVSESIEDNNTDDLVAVLESLGYKQLEIKKILKDIDTTLPVESQVKEALKLLLK